jgi:translation initiation factor 4E
MPRIVDETNDSTAQELTIESERPGADEEIRTVFNDATTFNVKHPLYSSWTLWFDSPNTKNRTGTGTWVSLFEKNRIY